MSVSCLICVIACGVIRLALLTVLDYLMVFADWTCGLGLPCKHVSTFIYYSKENWSVNGFRIVLLFRRELTHESDLSRVFGTSFFIAYVTLAVSYCHAIFIYILNTFNLRTQRYLDTELIYLQRFLINFIIKQCLQS